MNECIILLVGVGGNAVKGFVSKLHVKRLFWYGVLLGWHSEDPFCKTSRPAVWPTQPPAQYVPGAPSRGWSGQGVTLTTHHHLAPRLRMNGAIPLSLPMCLFDVDRDNFTITFCTFYLKQGVKCELNWTGRLWSPVVRLLHEVLVPITINILGHLNFWFLSRE
jgi:hypothetical protein